jgi:hypothetical protein
MRGRDRRRGRIATRSAASFRDPRGVGRGRFVAQPGMMGVSFPAAVAAGATEHDA